MAEERPSPSSIHDHPDGTTPAVPQSPDAEVEPVPALPRKRDPQWSEVHDPFDTPTAAVDQWLELGLIPLLCIFKLVVCHLAEAC